MPEVAAAASLAVAAGAFAAVFVVLVTVTTFGAAEEIIPPLAQNLVYQAEIVPISAASQFGQMAAAADEVFNPVRRADWQKQEPAAEGLLSQLVCAFVRVVHLAAQAGRVVGRIVAAWT